MDWKLNGAADITRPQFEVVVTFVNLARFSCPEAL